jgi:hypothetical protein
MADYNWEMTGPPDEVTIATDPEAVASWNNYVEQATSDFGGGYNTPFAPEAIANPVYEDPTYWNSGKQAYQGGDGQTYYAENFLRPENYVEMGYAAPYTQEQILAAVNPENIRYGYANTPYASVFGSSNLSGGEYVVNPDTGRFVLDKSGNPIPVPQDPRAGDAKGFDKIMTQYVIPAMLAAGAIGTGAGALGLIGEGAALAGSGEAGLLGTSGEGVVGQAGNLTAGTDLANLVANYPTMSPEQLASIMEINYGTNPLTALDAGRLAAEGFNPATIDQVLGYSYTPLELAGTGIESFAIPPASPGFGDFLSSFGNLLKTPLGQLGARSGLGLLSSGANTAPKVPGAAAGGSYVPKGMVDYAGILNLLAPKTSTRTSLLG